MLLTSILSDPSNRQRQGFDLKSNGSSATARDNSTAAQPTIWSASQWSRIAEVGDAEVRAAQKISDAKEQLEFLRRSGFPDEVVARLAQELEHKVQAAASEFAAATSGSASNADVTAVEPATAATRTSDALTATATGDAVQASPTPESETGDADQPHALRVAKVVNAYKAVMDDGDQFKALTDTSSTDDKFEALLEEIKALAAKALQEASRESSDDPLAS